jgi:hypothetical protein
MISLKIEGANVQLAKDQPQYLTLWAKRKVLIIPDGRGGAFRTVQWQSSFEPTPDEIERIKQGAPVIYTILGEFPNGYPPMRLEVGEIPE